MGVSDCLIDSEEDIVMLKGETRVLLTEEEIQAGAHQVIEGHLEYTDGEAPWLTLEGLHKLFEYLHSQGCALKVEGELPKDWYNDEADRLRIIEDFKEAGYTAWEPLIDKGEK